MNYQSFSLLCPWWRRILACIFLLMASSSGLSIDGLFLLSFKYSILSDPLGVMKNWNHHDATPCAWNGVACGDASGSGDGDFQVTGLSLARSGLLGSIPATLGRIQHLRLLNLSGNSINGSIPSSLFRATELQILDVSNNLVSGELSELVGSLTNLRVLDLSDNALAGNLPRNLTTLQNLTSVSLQNNYLFGSLLGGFDSVRVLDLSSNLINGPLPPGFGGGNLSYFNISFNRISGGIPPEFASRIPGNATIDLSFNNLTGPIPESFLFFNQEAKSYAGNPELCGKPLTNPCYGPSSITTQPNKSPIPESPPAIAAIPQFIGSIPGSAGGAAAGDQPHRKENKIKIATILGIVVGDVVGICVVAAIVLYVYNLKQRKATKNEKTGEKDFDWASSASSSQEEQNWLKTWPCMKKPNHSATEEEEEISSESSGASNLRKNHEVQAAQERKTGELVTFDGEQELEMESLLKASAYILGASGSSIMYKAVLEDGTALAVRRIGESGVERFRDFENRVRVMAKLVHPNLVQIRGFYWGAEEKLVIYEFVPNGSLANARFRKVGSSPGHLPWETRLKVAKGVARGLCYIHEKKHVHGNLKPCNILLGPDMEPKIGDFGLERLVSGEKSSTNGGSARNFGSRRSTASRDSFQDFASGATPSPSPSPSALFVSPYHAPESLRSLKPNPKWDVFSFGAVWLELLTGKVVTTTDEIGPGLILGASTSAEEDKGKVLKMADVAIRADLEGKEEALLALFKLGYNCMAPVPQRRPSMKEVLSALEKLSSSSSY